MKVLIIQTAFIGDVILATPVIVELKRVKPEASIDVLVRKGNEGLLSNNSAVNSVLTWDKKQHKTKQLLKVLKTIRSNKYDVVINLQRFFSTGLLTAFSGAAIKIGFDKNPLSFLFTTRVVHQIDGNKYEHETTRNLKSIKQFGATDHSRPFLFPSDSDFENVKFYKSTSYFCIAPTSVWFTKQLPAEKWKELIQLLFKNHPESKIYLLGGPSDYKDCHEICIDCNSSALVNLAGKLSFLQTAALMKDAQMNYVNDSAPLHIASAMNAAVTVFYCSTVPAFGFGPLSDISRIIENNEVKCRPCGLHGYNSCPEGHFSCAYKLNMKDSV